MNPRPVGSVVYVGGSMTPMVVVRPDQTRQSEDRAMHRMIKLRPQAGGEAAWHLSSCVMGDEK